MAENETTIEQFLSLPYGQRRLIIVGEPYTPPQASILRDVAFLVAWWALLPHALWKVRKAKEATQLVTVVTPTIADQLTFPVGHPRDRMVYAAHPVAPRLYYPLAQFHEHAFLHKFLEAWYLLESLGATEINVHHEVGWSKDMAVAAGLDLLAKAGGEKAKASASSNQTSRREGHLSATYDGSVKAHKPDDLVWYDHEPAWQRLVDARLKSGAKTFSLELRYTDDFGVNASLAAKVQGAGLDLGGTFSGHQSTIWILQGTYS